MLIFDEPNSMNLNLKTPGDVMVGSMVSSSSWLWIFTCVDDDGASSTCTW